MASCRTLSSALVLICGSLWQRSVIVHHGTTHNKRLEYARCARRTGSSLRDEDHP